MHVRKPLALLVVVMVAGFGVVAGAQAKKPAAKKARVFFVEPKTGATVTSPVHLKFGSAGIEIAAVPQGDVTKARPGVAHYHVGIDTSLSGPRQNHREGHAFLGPFRRRQVRDRHAAHAGEAQARPADRRRPAQHDAGLVHLDHRDGEGEPASRLFVAQPRLGFKTARMS